MSEWRLRSSLVVASCPRLIVFVSRWSYWKCEECKRKKRRGDNLRPLRLSPATLQLSTGQRASILLKEGNWCIRGESSWCHHDRRLCCEPNLAVDNILLYKIMDWSIEKATAVCVTRCVLCVFAGRASWCLRTGCRPIRSLPGLVTAHLPTNNTAASCRTAGPPHPDTHTHAR